jgi:hypothetical protein
MQTSFVGQLGAAQSQQQGCRKGRVGRKSAMPCAEPGLERERQDARCERLGRQIRTRRVCRFQGSVFQQRSRVPVLGQWQADASARPAFEHALSKRQRRNAPPHEHARITPGGFPQERPARLANVHQRQRRVSADRPIRRPGVVPAQLEHEAVRLELGEVAREERCLHDRELCLGRKLEAIRSRFRDLAFCPGRSAPEHEHEP